MSLPRGRTSPWKSQTPKSDIPSPLHIIKRTKTVEFRHNAKRDTSNGSIDYGPERPLSVMKKRQCLGPIGQGPRAHDEQVTNGKSTFKMNSFKPNTDRIPSAQRQPKSQAPLRWFSRQRISSSGTTCRRYSSRSRSSSSDQSSIGPSPSAGFLDEVSASEPPEYRSSAHLDTSFSNIPTSASYNDDCHLLVPHVSITPEVQTFKGPVYAVWATIEISVRLSRPHIDNMLDANTEDSSLLSNPLRVGSVSRFGYLYNLQVDVFPTSQTTILEVITGDNKRLLNLGSTILVLAKVQIDCRRHQNPHGTMIRKSDELIADLESELGLDHIKYLQVCLQYHHSGFSTSNNATPIDGTVDCQTRLKTTATGVIDKHALHSPWSTSHVEANKSSLFDIVASYWGPLRANQIFPQKTHQAGVVMRNMTIIDDSKAMEAKDSLSHQATTSLDPFTSLSHRQADLQPPSPEQEDDPARKIWAEMRRRTSRSHPTIHATNVGNSSGAAGRTTTGRLSTGTSPIKMKSEVDRRREMIRDIALRNQRSIGAESLKSLVPSMMNLEMSSKEAWGDSSSNTSNKENIPPERRKEGRWSFAGWW
ncbi:hypothetical protein F4680DRAFT_161668 [Xylaria scruposa]|nr:hypothetical protein F4680DRAFT_161668 [Xylaria scruposa]